MDETRRLHPPNTVREIARTLEAAGHETWAVGGAVRDALLGRTHLDWDLATQATPEVVRSLFRRTFPVGIEYGTVGVLDRDGVLHEVTTFRRDVRTDGRHAEVEYGVSLDEDLARRDFTINAIAYSPEREVLHDPFDGRADLRRGIVRAVGRPAERMKEDRLRALRALRFAARFDFEIAAETWQAIVESAPFLTRLSRERVRQELEKTMEQVRRPSRAMALWRQSGALAALLPALVVQPDDAFRAADHIGLPDLTSRAELASARRLNRLATLFLGLDDEGVRRTLRELRASNRELRWIAHLAGAWAQLRDQVEGMFDAAAHVPESWLRRWAARAGRTVMRDLLRVTYARWCAGGSERAMHGGGTAITVYRQALRVAYRDPVSLGDLAVDGDDLHAAGFAAGPELGTLLRRLLDRVLEDPELNSRDRLLDLARRIAGGAPGDEDR